MQVVAYMASNVINKRVIRPRFPKILYKIVAKIVAKIVTKDVTSPKQLLYVRRNVTCDDVIYRPFRTLIHENS